MTWRWRKTSSEDGNDDGAGKRDPELVRQRQPRDADEPRAPSDPRRARGHRAPRDPAGGSGVRASADDVWPASRPRRGGEGARSRRGRMVVPARLGALQGRRDGDRRHGVRWPHRRPARRPRHQGEAALGARRTGRGEEGLREGRGPPRDARRTRAPRRPGRLRRAADRDLLGWGRRHRRGGVRAGPGDPRRRGLRLDHRAQLVPAAEARRPAVPQDGHGHLRRGQEGVLLAGAVGGTKTALALFDRRDGALVLERETELSSREFPSLEDAVARFLASPRRLRIDAACFGVAGPVVDGRSVTTNLPWQIDEATLRARIPARRVRLLNDLEATGYGVLTLPPTALAPLQPGTRRRGTVALIAAGTGLGEALLIWDGQRH